MALIGTRPFTPADIAKVAWYDPSDLSTITGAPVTGYADKSGNGYDLTGTGVTRPVSGQDTLNGLNVLTFNADLLQNLGANIAVPSGNIAMFAVYDFTLQSNVNDPAIVSLRTAGGDKFAVIDGTDDTSFNPSLKFINGAYTREFSAPNSPFNDPCIVSAFADAGNDLLGIYINGQNYNSRSDYVASPVTLYDDIQIGRNFGNPSLSGLYGEILLIEDCTESTRQKIEGYLAHKWGLTANLPYLHPYKYDKPTVGVDAPPLFSASDITTEGWYDGADTTTLIMDENGKYASWGDKSGKVGKFLLQPNPARRPTQTTVNGLNAIEFTKEDYTHMFDATGLDNDIKSLFIVFKSNEVITEALPVKFPSPPSYSPPFLASIYGTEYSNGIALGSQTGALTDEVLSVFDEATAATFVDRCAASKNTLPSINTDSHQTNFVREAGACWRIGIDGGDNLQDLTSGVRHDLLFSNGWGVGASLRRAPAPDSIVEFAWDGAICEVIAIKDEVSDETREKLEGYLAWKWGLTASLPVGHPYKLEPPRASTTPAPSYISSSLPTAAVALSTAELVNTYWATNYPYTVMDRTWDDAAYLTGAMRLLEETDAPAVDTYVENWGNRFSWNKPTRGGFPGAYHADDQLCGQVYADYYEYEGSTDPSKISNIKANLDAQIALLPAVNYWTWCDTVYMAPATFTKMGVIQGDNSYHDAANDFWTFCRSTWSGGLYDETSHLWYRDENWFYPANQTANGSKVFWSRGNGWVFAGLARVLTDLPSDSPYRTEYETVFTEMAVALAACQRDDGFWGSNLLDATDPPYPETSGTSFFTFGFSWGVNNGLLDRATYAPVIGKAWNALAGRAISASGKLGWVQQIGQSPYDDWTAGDEKPYAVGAFVQAGVEISIMQS